MVCHPFTRSRIPCCRKPLDKTELISKCFLVSSGETEIRDEATVTEAQGNHGPTQKRKYQLYPEFIKTR